MVYRMELTWKEVLDILVEKYSAGSTIGYTLPPGFDEVSDVNLILKSLTQSKVKVTITIDDFRLRSNFTTIKTINFTIDSFFVPF